MNKIVTITISALLFSTVSFGHGSGHAAPPAHKHAGDHGEAEHKHKPVHKHGKDHGETGHKHEAGHDHSKYAVEIEKFKTQGIGRTTVERLVKEGKIDISWKKSTYEKSIKKTFGHNKEWIVTFENPNGVKGKKLSIYLKLSGEYIAANFKTND